jgi:RNA polymerase sigma factor (sigma-70 family)
MAVGQLSAVIQFVHAMARKGASHDLSDAELLRRFIRHRDETAFESLVQRHGPMVLGLCRRVLRHDQDAEDAFQATFLVLVRKAATLRSPGTVANWLYGVAHRTALELRRASTRRHAKEAMAMPRAEPLLDLPADFREVFDEELARLSDKYREAVVLCDLQSKTRRDVARELGCAEGTVASRLARGRALLAKRLVRRGVGSSAGAFVAAVVCESASAQVPGMLASSTTRAAALLAAGHPLSSIVSTSVVAVTEGVLKSMLLMKLKILAAAFVILATSVCTAGVLSHSSVAEVRATPTTLGQQRNSAAQALPRATDLYGDPLPPGVALRLGTVRYRLGAGSIGFLPDGKTILVPNLRDGSVVLVDGRTGEIKRQIRTESVPLQSRGGLVLAPNAMSFAFTRIQGLNANQPQLGLITIWDLESEKALRTFERKPVEIGHEAMALSADGKLLASITEGGNLRVEDTASGELLIEHAFPDGKLLVQETALGATIAISNDGSTLAVAAGRNWRRLFTWKWRTETEPRELKTARSDYRGPLVFAPDGDKLIDFSYGSRSIRLWDIAQGRIIYTIKPLNPDREFNHAHFSKDSKTLFTTSDNGVEMGAIDLWDAAIGRHLSRLFGESGNIGDLAVSGGGGLLAISSGSMVRVWDLTTGKELSNSNKGHIGAVSCLAALNSFAVTASEDTTVRLWDLNSGKQLLKVAHGQGVRAVAVSPDGTKMASSSFDDSVCVWDTATGQKIQTLPGHGGVGAFRALGFSPEGKYLLSWGDDFNLRKWRLADGKAEFEVIANPVEVKLPAGVVKQRMLADHKRNLMSTPVFSPDAKYLILGISDYFIVQDTASGADLKQIPYEGGWVHSMAVSPDSRLLLASSSGKRVQTQRPDGQVIYTEEKDQPVCVWDVATGKLLRKIVVSDGSTGPCAFAADGKSFAVAVTAAEPRIAFWDIASGKKLHSIDGFLGTVRSLAFTPDGKRLICGLDDSTALVWNLPPR